MQSNIKNIIVLDITQQRKQIHILRSDMMAVYVAKWKKDVNGGNFERLRNEAERDAFLDHFELGKEIEYIGVER